MNPITRAILGLADIAAQPQDDQPPQRCDRTPDLFAAEAAQEPQERPEGVGGYRPSRKPPKRSQRPAAGQDGGNPEPPRPRRGRYRIF